jgi:hypothetical protein
MKHTLGRFFVLFVWSICGSPLFALGSYAEGWVVAKILQFESRGLIFESYEGVMEINSYNPEEKCAEEKDECFVATKIKKNFSVRPENGDVVNLLKKSINQELLLQYKVHMVTAIALSSDTELLGALQQTPSLPEVPEMLSVKKTGSKRNFSIQGKILQLEYQGYIVGTYEGLYLDENRGKVHSFSVTDPKMAEHAWKTMKSSKGYYMGISVSFTKGFRKSNYDLFEVNYKEPAGGVTPEKTENHTQPTSSSYLAGTD